MTKATARPVLGMICCKRSVGSEFGQSVMERYLYGAAPHMEAIPLLVPSLPDIVDPHEVARRIDGLMLTGSPSNVDPKHYGEEVPDPPGPFDPNRDHMAMALAEAMMKAGKPVFGICRGFQELNVHFGGTLRRDMADPDRAFQHHAPDEIDFNGMFEHRHPVTLEDGGVLMAAIGQKDIIVNSVHYQGVDRLGFDLKVEARAPDGVVEAFSTTARGAPVLAVQWHPEWKPEADAVSRKVFGLMGRVLRGAGV
jgi:putative glutamine amidotransferase